MSPGKMQPGTTSYPSGIPEVREDARPEKVDDSDRYLETNGNHVSNDPDSAKTEEGDDQQSLGTVHIKEEPNADRDKAFPKRKRRWPRKMNQERIFDTDNTQGDTSSDLDGTTHKRKRRLPRKLSQDGSFVTNHTQDIPSSELDGSVHKQKRGRPRKLDSNRTFAASSTPVPRISDLDEIINKLKKESNQDESFPTNYPLGDASMDHHEAVTKRPRGRPRKLNSDGTFAINRSLVGAAPGSSKILPKRPRGRPRKHPKPDVITPHHQNDAASNATVILQRQQTETPTRHDLGGSSDANQNDTSLNAVKIPPKRERGPKILQPHGRYSTSLIPSSASFNAAHTPPKRGRPRKVQSERKITVDDNQIVVRLNASFESSSKRQRGRPKKSKLQEIIAKKLNPKVATLNAIKTLPKRRRGRLIKLESDGSFTTNHIPNIPNLKAIEPFPKRRRGRPRKLESDRSLAVSLIPNDRRLNAGKTPLKRGPPTKLTSDGRFVANRQSRSIRSQQFNGKYPTEHPRNLIPELCRQMYKNGWMAGTGGSVSVKEDGRIFITPSGVAKERILPQDLFVLDQSGEVIDSPAQYKQLKVTDNSEVFLSIHSMRNAGAIIHSHSPKAVMATLICNGHEFKISHQETIKGLLKGNSGERYSNTDTLIIPIIENLPSERDLKDRVTLAMERYPMSNAVLIRRHGLYVWGSSWKSAKAQAECLDYLFDLALEMHRHGIDPAAGPVNEEVDADSQRDGLFVWTIRERN